MTVLDCKWVADKNHVFTPSKYLSGSWSITKNCNGILQSQKFVEI